MKSKLTVMEMAKRAKVSVATISRALNPETRPKVAADTLARVDHLIQKHNFTPHLAAKNLRRSSYQTIGVLFPHHEGILLSDYYSQILSGVADSLLHSNYYLKMILLKPEKPKWDHYDFKTGEGVDGLIVTYWRTFFSDPSVLERLTIPCAIINNIEKNIKAHFVAGDHFAGGRMAAQYLVNKGHRKIALLTGSQGAPDAKRRFDGFQSFLAEKGIKLNPSAIFDVNFEEEKAYQVTETLLAKRPDVTAIFCMNDTLAFGVLKRLKELGVACPGKISVMGYDNDRRAELSDPTLTSIQVPIYEAAKRATSSIIEHLKEKDAKKFFGQPELFPVSLIERRSVRKI
jgi:LacI family transcriptional regulator